MFERLKQFYAEHGNSDVANSNEDDRQLATWVAYQRAQRKKEALSEEQIKLLEEIEFTWKYRDRGSWEDRLAEVISFKKIHGHCDIPLKLTDPPKLGAFVNATRVQRNKGVLSAERIAKLDAVGFLWGKDMRIREDGMNEVWKNRFDELLEYKQMYGNCKVPGGWKENAQLGNWVHQQRQAKKNGKLHSERIRLLEEIGFVWETYKQPS